MECIISYVSRRQLDLIQVLSNLACSGLILLAQPITDQSYLLMLQWVMQHSVAAWETTPVFVQFVCAIVLLDLTVYCMHRLQHASPIIWWIHETHHQATQMNLSVGFRQNFFSFLYVWLAVVPLLFLGFDREVILATLFAHRLYDALMHTASPVGFGKLEWILVSPKLHRVHHGYEKKYVNKNFANVFIIFDRILGTYQAPEEKHIPIGLGQKKGPTLNPIWASVRPLIDLLKIRKLKQLFLFSNKY
jgi:sterol desaturase/sphingolipid hydroxylase (fatty acid hydroxylase superfamily)